MTDAPGRMHDPGECHRVGWHRGTADTGVTCGGHRDILGLWAGDSGEGAKYWLHVAMLCECPTGQEGRPSKSLTYAQADAVLTAAEADDSTIGDYTVVSVFGGVRTEEARPLTWEHVHLPNNDTEPPHVDVFRSVRTGGDTKARRSRRSLALPHRAVRALRRQHARQAAHRERAGQDWQEDGLVSASQVGTEMDRHNVLRGFRRILQAAGLNPHDWTPRELRHSREECMPRVGGSSCRSAVIRATLMVKMGRAGRSEAALA
jgi:integrase